MSESPHVRDVTAASFATDVVEESRRRPVLVDFWAAWCGPCRMLGPVLERVADDLGGKLLVAKVDTETNQELAMRFGIRGIPACKLFVDGAVADEFVGALPEPAVREFIGRHIKSDLEVQLAAVAEARRSGDSAAAAAALEPLLAAQPDNPAVLVEAARVALAQGLADLAAERAGAVSAAADEHDVARALVTAAELARACAAAGAGDADDFTRGACQAIAGDWKAAFETMLGIARTDSRAREAMLAGFVLCEDPDLARTYRRKLAIAT